MKKVIFVLLMSLMFLGTYAQTDEQKIEVIQQERTMEVIPTLSATGGGDGIALDSEVIIAKKFHLSKKWSLYAQAGAMYNAYDNNGFDEWQLGFEPMVGLGTKHFRLSGFLNSLTVKAFDTGKMPFVEGGVRFSITPWRKMWVSVFATWPISDRILVSPLEDAYLENEEGVFLIETNKWAYQIHSYGADIDLGIGKKFVASLDGFATDEDNYQLGAGLQYQLFKNKPWILGGGVHYTKFEEENYYYIHNLFPGMFGNEMDGYTFKLGVSNYGGLGELNFSQMLGRLAEPMYFSPVKWKLESKATKINEKFKIDCCNIGDALCLDWAGAICISGGKSPFKIFVQWGDGTTQQFEVTVPGNYPLHHQYEKEGQWLITISGMDSLGTTSKPCSNQINTKECNKKSECAGVTLKFDVSQNKVKKLGTVYFNWDVQGAEQVTFDGKEVAPVVPKYPVIFNELGKFSYTLKAWSKGKVCLEETITITVSDCDLPIVEVFTAEPLKIIGKGSTLVTWVTSGADLVTLNGKPIAASGSQSFEVTGPMDFTLKAENKCDSVEKTIHVDYVPCILCNDIYFHDGSSQTDNFTTGLPCGGPLHIPYTIYNESEWCEYDVEIKWQIFMDTDTSTPTYSGSYIVHVPANSHPLNLFFDFTPVGATLQCCYRKVELKIGACTN